MNTPASTSLQEPFVGIRPYTRMHADVFFERRDEARALLETLLTRRVLMLYGESGNGKSSLINAGLVPMLERMRFGESLQPEVLRIEQDFKGLTVDRRPLSSTQGIADSAFHSLFVKPGESDTQPTFTLPVKTALTQLREYLAKPQSRHVLLIFDQFEELHTYGGTRSAFSVHADRGKEEELRQKSEARLKAQAQMAAAIGDLLRASAAQSPSDEDSAPDGSDRLLPVKFLFVFREEYLVKLQALLPDLHAASPLRLPFIPADRLARIVEGPFLSEDKLEGRRAGPFEKHEHAEFYRGHAIPLREGFKVRSGGIGQNVLTEMQVVCTELWNEAGDRLKVRVAAKGGPSKVAKVIDEIIEAHFRRALEGMGSQRNLALDLLCEMVTTAGTRNIASEPSLRDLFETRASLELEEYQRRHSWDTIKGVLKTLDEHRFINRAERNAIAYYDIASEALIGWLSGVRRKRLEQVEQKRILRRLGLWLGGIFSVAMFAMFLWVMRERNIAQDKAVELATQTEEAERQTYLAKSQTALANARFSQEEGQRVRAQQQISVVEKTRDDAIQLVNELKQQLENIKKELTAKKLSSPSLNQISQVVTSIFDEKPRLPLAARLAGHRGPIHDAVFSSDGRFIASVSADKLVKVWSYQDEVTEKYSAAASSSAGGTRAVVFVPGSDYLITGSNGQSVRLFDWGSGRSESVSQLEDSGDSITHLIFSPSDPDLLLIARVGGCYLHRLPSNTPASNWLALGNQTHRWPFTKGQAVNSAAFSDDGSRMVSCSDDTTVRVFSTKPDFEVIKDDFVTDRLADYPNLGAPARAFVFAPHSNHLVAGGAGHQVILWDVGSGQILQKLEASPGGIGHAKKSGVVGVAFSSDAKYLASIATDGQCILWHVDWDPATPQAVMALPTKIQGRLLALAWKNDVLALGGEDGGMELWDMKEFREPPLQSKAPSNPAKAPSPYLVFTEQAHAGVLGGLSFTDLGNYLLTWSGLAETNNLASAKGKAAEWSTAESIKRSDNSVAVWDVKAAVSARNISRAPVPKLLPTAKIPPIPLYRINDGQTRAVPGKPDWFVWVGKLSRKDQRTLNCRVFKASTPPATWYAENDVDVKIAALSSAKTLLAGDIGKDSPLMFSDGGKSYTLEITDLSTGLFKNDHVDLELREQ